MSDEQSRSPAYGTGAGQEGEAFTDSERLSWCQAYAPTIEYKMHMKLVGFREWHVRASTIGGDAAFGKSTDLREAIDQAMKQSGAVTHAAQAYRPATAWTLICHQFWIAKSVKRRMGIGAGEMSKCSGCADLRARLADAERERDEARAELNATIRNGVSAIQLAGGLATDADLRQWIEGKTADMLPAATNAEVGMQIDDARDAAISEQVL